MQHKNTKPKNYNAGDYGEISGYFATFDHDRADGYGDVIRKGAFLRTIEERRNTGHPFPFCWNHDFSIIIGTVTDIGEDEKGAFFTAKFFPTEKAQEIRSIVKSGVLWQFSFAYDILDYGNVKLLDGTTARELRDLDLYEISIVTVPANPRAVITDIKSDSDKPSLTPEQLAIKEKLMDSIGEIEREQHTSKEALLAFIDGGERHWDPLLRRINDYKKNSSAISDQDLRAVKENLEKMEQNALRDIGQADIHNDLQWKAERKYALDAIREQISLIDCIMSNRKTRHGEN